MVVDVVYRDGGPAVADELGHPVDQRRIRLGHRPDPLIQHQPAVHIEAQQRLERQGGAEPRGRGADPAAAPQVVQTVNDDEGLSARDRRTRRGFNGIEVCAGGRRTGRGQCDEPDPIAADRELITRTAGPNSRAAATAELTVLDSAAEM